MEEENTNNKITEVERLYEVSFLIVPTKEADEAVKKSENIKDFILEEGGTCVSEGRPNIISLAYPMAQMVSNKKIVHESGYFGWIKFKSDADKIDSIKNMLDSDTDIIRFLIIKTKEHAPAPAKRRAPGKTFIKKEAPKESEKHKKIDEEKLDKELEELLTT